MNDSERKHLRRGATLQIAATLAPTANSQSQLAGLAVTYANAVVDGLAEIEAAEDKAAADLKAEKAADAATKPE